MARSIGEQRKPSEPVVKLALEELKIRGEERSLAGGTQNTQVGACQGTVEIVTADRNKAVRGDLNTELEGSPGY